MGSSSDRIRRVCGAIEMPQNGNHPPKKEQLSRPPCLGLTVVRTANGGANRRLEDRGGKRRRGKGPGEGTKKKRPRGLIILDLLHPTKR